MTTMITGSNAAGEELPPHFQFQNAAKIQDTHRMKVEMAQYYPRVLDCTFGLNPKSGMDDEEFEKNIMNLITCLYPDALGTVGQ